MLADVGRMMVDFIGAGGELTLHRLGADILARHAPRSSKPRPVITLPGFMASDDSMGRLTDFLVRQGFRAQSWGLGRNQGLQGATWKDNLDKIRRHMTGEVRKLADQCSAPVALVGHSLGGVYARELAWHLESEVDRVITLGSPTIHPYRRDRHNQAIQAFASWFNRQSATEFGGREGLLHWDPDRPKLPCIAIHSPLDGFVHESACHIPGYIVAQSTSRAPRENVRVLATHTGMMFSVWVLLALADRLLADRRRWKPFDPQAYFPSWASALARVPYPAAGELARDAGSAAFVRLNQ